MQSHGPSGEGKFDPTRYFIKLPKRQRASDGSWHTIEQDYLEVKWRLVWLRAEHQNALIETECVEHGEQFALFKASVSIPDGGSATGWGSETAADFADFIEKAETKAVGRALAALGYGTQFCDDFEFSAGAKSEATRVVDAPVSRPPTGRTDGQPAPTANVTPMRGAMPSRVADGAPTATEPQIKAMYAIARGQLALDSEELDAQCRERYNVAPQGLTRRQASEFIDALKLAIGGTHHD